MRLRSTAACALQVQHSYFSLCNAAFNMGVLLRGKVLAQTFLCDDTPNMQKHGHCSFICNTLTSGVLGGSGKCVKRRRG